MGLRDEREVRYVGTVSGFLALYFVLGHLSPTLYDKLELNSKGPAKEP